MEKHRHAALLVQAALNENAQFEYYEHESDSSSHGGSGNILAVLENPQFNWKIKKEKVIKYKWAYIYNCSDVEITDYLTQDEAEQMHWHKFAKYQRLEFTAKEFIKEQ